MRGGGWYVRIGLLFTSAAPAAILATIEKGLKVIHFYSNEIVFRETK